MTNTYRNDENGACDVIDVFGSDYFVASEVDASIQALQADLNRSHFEQLTLDHLLAFRTDVRASGATWDDSFGFYLDDQGIFYANPWETYLAGLAGDADGVPIEDELAVDAQVFRLGRYLYVRAPA